MFANTSYLTI